MKRYRLADVPKKKTDAEVLETQDTLEMIKRPHLWPRWPVLPVKRYGGGADDPMCGVLFACEGVENVVIEENMFALDGDVKALLDNPQIKRHTYATAEELAADGWIVD